MVSPGRHHPVRSIKGCCRDILLMSRPPLLIRGGENAHLFCEALFAYRSRHAFGRALEWFDLQIGRRILHCRAWEWLFEELFICHVNLDNEALPCRVEVESLDCRQGRRVQQPFGRLTGLLDILVQHTCCEVGSLDDERVRIPMTNGMT